MQKIVAANAMLEGNLNDVLVFTKVVDAGSFTSAAKEIGVPTSTVSRRVSRLEDHLGVRLLQRTTRKLNLTDAGRTYYERVSDAVAELGNAERELSEVTGAPKGRVRVTAPAEFHTFTPLIASFLESYPEVNVEFDLSNRNVDLVAEGYDVAIRAGRLADSSLIAHRLANSTMCLVASPQYLADHGTPQTVEDLKTHQCILFGPFIKSGVWTLQTKKESVRVPVRGRFATTSLVATREAAMGDLGIALIPKTGIARDLCHGRLFEVLPGVTLNEGALWVLYPSREHLAPAVRAFVDFVKENFSAFISDALFGATDPCPDEKKS
jgi:DNA-binding transcriptional LysR family regulator